MSITDIVRLSNLISSYNPSISKHIINSDIIHIVWHITNKCNLKCKYCFTNSDSSYPLPKQEVLKNTANFIAKLKPKILSIIGGEPLLINTGLLAQVLRIVKKNPSTTINIDTNAILVKEQVITKLEKYIYQWNTTVDAITDVHNKLRGGLRATLKGIKLLKQHNQRVSVNIVVSLLNYKGKLLEDTVKYLLKIGVDRVNLAPLKEFGRAKYSDLSPLNLSLTEYNKLVKKLKRLSRKYAITLDGWTDPRLKKDFQTCFCGFKRITIDWEGRIYPCELMIFDKEVKGIELKHVKSKRELLEKLLWWAVFTSINPPECSNCEFKQYCRKGCRCLTYISSGIPFAKPVTCRLKPNSVYEVIGYNQYSPLFKEGMLAMDNPKVKLVLKALKRYEGLYDTIYELGAGAGRWVYTIEKALHKKVVGFEVNKTMLELWALLKKAHNLKSRIEYRDITKDLPIHKNSVYLLLDNFVTHFSKTFLKTLFKKLPFMIISFIPRVAKNSVLKYELAGKQIIEYQTIVNDNKIKKVVYNGLSKAVMYQYFYSLKHITNYLVSSDHEILALNKFKNLVVLTSKKLC